jgi:hypothetical protein
MRGDGRRVDQAVERRVGVEDVQPVYQEFAAQPSPLVAGVDRQLTYPGAPLLEGVVLDGGDADDSGVRRGDERRHGAVVDERLPDGRHLDQRVVGVRRVRRRVHSRDGRRVHPAGAPNGVPRREVRPERDRRGRQVRASAFPAPNDVTVTQRSGRRS